MTHKKQPGKLGYQVVVAAVQSQITQVDSLKPLMRAHTLANLEKMGIATEKHKTSVRETRTIARSMDRLVRVLIFAEENGAKADFSPTHPFAEAWQCLDVLGQRYSAIELVLQMQAEDATVSV